MAGTAYLCTEASCAKHLPDGPCGGSKPDDECEVQPGVTCAWVRIYREAHAAGTLDEVAREFVPTKAIGQDHTCSWINMAFRRDHRAVKEASAQDQPPAAG